MKVVLPGNEDHDPLQIIPNGPPGTPGNLNTEQSARLVQLRELLVSKGYKKRLDTPSLLRFLRARKFSVEDAFEMFANCEAWRIEFKVDDICKNFVFDKKSEISKYYPQFYHKTDIDGRPIYIEQLGKIDLDAMLKITTTDKMLQNLVYEYEKLVNYRLPACSAKAGHLIETSCTIMDLSNASIRSLYNALHFLKEASKIGQHYYPERMGKFYIINAPYLFSGAWALVKPFLDAVTVEKIHILRYDFKKEVLQQIDENNLASSVGGLSISEDPKVPIEMSDIGPWNDPKYFVPVMNEWLDLRKGSGL